MADDTGTSLPASFGGGGGGNQGWVGRFETQAPLSQHTRWLELGGMRLNLTYVDPSTVTTEQLPQTSPAADFLRHRAAAEDHLLTPDDDPVITALIATGSLASDDPVLDELLQIAGQLQFFPARSRAIIRGRALARGGAVGQSGNPPPPPPLPEPWRSLKPATPGAGPIGTIPLGVATPLLEGTAAVVYALTSTAEGFRVDTTEVGGKPQGHFGQPNVDPAPSFAWWARDDLGHTHRGQWQGWGGSENERRGDVFFAPPLDPAARSLQLMPTARSSRAIIEITLPEWGESQ